MSAGVEEGIKILAAAGDLTLDDAANVAVKAMGPFNLKGKDDCDESWRP